MSRPPAVTAGVRAWLHLTVLWSFAVAQPVYDLLRRNGEFFVAHRVDTLDLLLFVGLLSLGIPLLAAAARAGLARVSPSAGSAALLALVGLFTAAIASQALAHRVHMAVWLHGIVVVAAGAAAAWAYRTAAPVRWFLTMLAPSVIVFPALFLLDPAMAALLRPDRATARAAAAVGDGAPPIVFVVFDQLPVTSIMDASGGIDRARFPGFARLAGTSTWYRNASTVAELTGWALPPIVTGVTPRPNHVPTFRSYPNNLFTWLGHGYRYEVFEAITELCPPRLCEPDRPPFVPRWLQTVLDTGVVYLHVVLPAGLRAHLPPLTENWKNFVRSLDWQRRWVSERDADRRRAPAEFIDAITADDPQPTLYFLHALLPHEPYLYLRTGQPFTDDTRLVGLMATGRWTRDEWPVAHAYSRHLLQVELVDEVVRRLIARLEEQELFDRSLVVVTSDHGVSFRPGRPFKGLEGESVVDIMAVPLFIKAPGQRHGTVDDRNVQSIDIVPTIADILDIDLTWAPEGRSAREPGHDPPAKTIFHGGAHRSISLPVHEFEVRRLAGAARRAAVFGETPGALAVGAPHRDLIGRRVETLTVERSRQVQVVVHEPARFSNVDPDGPELPGIISGRVFDDRGGPVDAELAVAVGGVVRAISRTYAVDEGVPEGSWSAVIDPRQLEAGRNQVQVFVIRGDGERRRLDLAYASDARPVRLNLVSDDAADYWRVQQSGFYPREGSPISFRWTSGTGSLVVPLEAPRPRTLRIGIALAPPGRTPLTITINDCVLFDGAIERTPWFRMFPLRDCPASTLAAGNARIEIRSAAVSSRNPSDPRRLGVAVETVNLFPEDWPPDVPDRAPDLAGVRVVGGDAGSHAAGGTVRLEVSNFGESVWLPASEQEQPGPAVEIALRWRPAARGGTPSEQRLQLPYPMFPEDRLLVEAPLVPPLDVRSSGPWNVTVVPVRRDGTALPVEADCVVAVQPDPAR